MTRLMLDEIYRDATFSAETRSQLRALVTLIELGLTPQAEQVAAVEAVIDSWDANGASRVVVSEERVA